MSTITTTTPSPLHLRLVDAGAPLDFRSTSATYLAGLRELVSRYSPVEWTDEASVKAFAWIEKVLSYRPGPVDTDDDVLTHVQQHIDELNKILANPLNGQALVDPMLENGHLWERRELDDYMVCYQALCEGPVISAYAEEEPEYIPTPVPAHALLMDLIRWRNSLPFGRVFERPGGAGPVPLAHTLVPFVLKEALVIHAPERARSRDEMAAGADPMPLVRSVVPCVPKEALVIRAPERELSPDEMAAGAGSVPLVNTLVPCVPDEPLVIRAPERKHSPDEMAAQLAMYRVQLNSYRSLAIAALMKASNEILMVECRDLVRASEVITAETRAKTEADVRELEVRLAADRAATDARIDGIETTYAAADAISQARIADANARLEEEHEKLVRTIETLAGARADVAALQRANADLRNQLNNIDTDGGDGCSVM